MFRHLTKLFETKRMWLVVWCDDDHGKASSNVFAKKQIPWSIFKNRNDKRSSLRGRFGKAKQNHDRIL